MQYAEDSKRIAAWLINNEIRENPIEKNILSCEIGAAVAEGRIFGDLVETLEDINNHAVSGLSKTASSISSNGSKDLAIPIRQMRVSHCCHLAACFFGTVDPALSYLPQSPVDFFIESLPLFPGPAFFCIQGFQCAAYDILRTGKTAASQTLL